MENIRGRDIRTGAEVNILQKRDDYCKRNDAVVVLSPPIGECGYTHYQHLPGGEVFPQYLCEYVDGWSWVDGQHIFLYTK